VKRSRRIERWSRSADAVPRDRESCGWIAALPPEPEPRPVRSLDGHLRADCAVVGAGFTGLAIARRLTELRPGWRVVVLEAQRAGDGASARSSGFLVDLVDFVSEMEPPARRRYVETAQGGIGALRRLVREHGIDCAWDDRGWLRAAAGPGGCDFLGTYPPLLDELGIGYERMDAEGMEAVTGSRFYRRGLRLTGYPLVQPAALVRGLARALPESVELYEETSVRRVERGRCFRLDTDLGSVTADRLFLATNGYTPGLGFLARKVFPLLTFGSLTRPLSDAEREAVGGEPEWGILAMDPMGSTVRRTRDQRLLIRNTVGYARKLRPARGLLKKARAGHRRALAARFPELGGIDLEHTWSGLMGTSWSRRHWFGELEPGLYAAAGYTGAGIAMGTASGTHLAELATGLPSEGLDALRELPKPNWMPPEPFLSFGGKFLAHRMNSQAGAFL
jgi:glycine/D-amino acid oxidase-like deaminating enzyme